MQMLEIGQDKTCVMLYVLINHNKRVENLPFYYCIFYEILSYYLFYPTYHTGKAISAGRG